MAIKTYVTTIGFKNEHIHVAHTYDTTYITIQAPKGTFVQAIQVGTTEKAQELVHSMAKMYNESIRVQISEVEVNPYKQTNTFYKIVK